MRVNGRRNLMIGGIQFKPKDTKNKFGNSANYAPRLKLQRPGKLVILTGNSISLHDFGGCLRTSRPLSAD